MLIDRLCLPIIRKSEKYLHKEYQANKITSNLKVKALQM